MFFTPIVTYIIHKIIIKTYRSAPFPKLKTTDTDFRSEWDKNTEANEWLKKLKAKK